MNETLETQIEPQKLTPIQKEEKQKIQIREPLVWKPVQKQETKVFSLKNSPNKIN